MTGSIEAEGAANRLRWCERRRTYAMSSKHLRGGCALARSTTTAEFSSLDAPFRSVVCAVPRVACPPARGRDLTVGNARGVRSSAELTPGALFGCARRMPELHLKCATLLNNCASLKEPFLVLLSFPPFSPVVGLTRYLLDDFHCNLHLHFCISACWNRCHLEYRFRCRVIGRVKYRSGSCDDHRHWTIYSFPILWCRDHDLHLVVPLRCLHHLRRPHIINGIVIFQSYPN